MLYPCYSPLGTAELILPLVYEGFAPDYLYVSYFNAFVCKK